MPKAVGTFDGSILDSSFAGGPSPTERDPSHMLSWCQCRFVLGLTLVSASLAPSVGIVQLLDIPL